MLRRCPAPLTMLVAALAFSLGSRPMSTQADATATYTLTTTTGIPGANLSPSVLSNLQSLSPSAETAWLEQNTVFTQGPPVQATVSPAGGVFAPSSSTQSPLTVLSSSSDIAANSLLVAIANSTNSAGQPLQEFGLLFLSQGLPAGGVLKFSLNTESSLTTPPQLQSLTSGVTITLDPTSSTTSSNSSANPGGGGGGGGPTVPEPLSLLIWSALAGAGLWRVRAQRRSQPVAL